MIDLNNLDSLIKSESQKISESFLNIALNGFVEKFDFIIDEKKLDSKYVNEVNITIEGDFAEIFRKLKIFEKYPALYFFQINPVIKKEEIISLIKNVNIEDGLNIPAQNKVIDNNGILYVGKVTECAWGRLIQHFGYHTNRKSHGLQLNNWANKTSLELELKYTVIFFDESMRKNMVLLECILAQSLKPIIGKH